jgi:hypothetical protein
MIFQMMRLMVELELRPGCEVSERERECHV